MDGSLAAGDERLGPPPRLFERLHQIAGYTWDESKEPFRSTYDNWHVVGTKHVSRSNGRRTRPSRASSIHSSAQRRRSSLTGSPHGESDSGEESVMSQEDGAEQTTIQVVARISTHILREERAYHICKSVIGSVDPNGNHITRPVDMMRLTPIPGEQEPLTVCIYEYPGPNALAGWMDYGPTWYKGQEVEDKDKDKVVAEEPPQSQEYIPLGTFLDFAIGAVECLELLHHGQRIVIGEIRGDAFHMNAKTNAVKLINFGSGLRTFEHGLTSAGWSVLSKEVGVKNKLAYMAPEQTGRMPAEPDSRTDIYSLGILFWTLLTRQPAFDGETPMDVIQGVLGQRLPSVSAVRLDIPTVISKIIQKMTAKNIGDRYNSASGLKHDLLEVQKLLEDGDTAALKHWQVGSKDVSSYFILPSDMIGRQKEHDEVVRILDKVSKRHMISQRQDVHSLSSGSSLSEGILEHYEPSIGEDISSEGDNASSVDGVPPSVATPSAISVDPKPHGSPGGQVASGSGSATNYTGSQESVRSNNSLRQWMNGPISMESRSLIDSISGDSSGIRSTDGVGGLTSQRNMHKFRRKGRCEVISIAGAAGLGKTCLVQSVQVEARRRGYFASSKFDRAQKTPFGPVLKLLSSLFKQVFSETNTETPFHHTLKQYVRPAWPMLHKVLGLPEFLLGTPGSSRSSLLSQNYNKSLRADMKRRDSSPSSAQGNQNLFNLSLGAQSSQDFLRAGTSTKSVRLMNTALDVLRLFTQHKFICFCLDDLQFADDESLDLVTQIISARMKMVIIVTYRPEEILPEKIRSIIDPPNTEAYVQAGGVGVTRIVLRSLTEENIVEYVSKTLRRPENEIVPLAAVVQNKTVGNPFYIREMLDTCYRKQCIWYDYKECIWRYDLDKIFKQFEAENYHDTLNHEFVTARLRELPSSARSILAWASLLGSSFSFEFVQKLLSGEFAYEGDDSAYDADACGDTNRTPLSTHSSEDAIEGLQAAIQAYIIISTQDDDKFRFAHDRYIQAASALYECNPQKMHFIIAQTLMRYYSSNDKSLDTAASHICDCIDIINKRVKLARPFRQLLFERAQYAAESGARPTAVKFYTACFALLKEDPWNDDKEDVYYDETLELYTRATECYVYMGQYEESDRLIKVIFSHARTAVDKAPSWILQSRVQAQVGDTDPAYDSLKQALLALGVKVDEHPTFEKCDAEFERLCLKIQSTNPDDIINKPSGKDSNIEVVGAVLAEITSAAFWSSSLNLYSTVLIIIDTLLTCGSFPQSGLGFVHLAMISITRFNMIKFASDMGGIALALFERWRDPYTLGRGGTIYQLFVAHIQYPIGNSIGPLEETLEYTIQAGDRLSTMLNFGMAATIRFFASDHLADLESFCMYGCEEIPSWHTDTRGGTMLIAVRQVSRALQGKTWTSDPLEVMSDSHHQTSVYKAWLKSKGSASSRSNAVYEALEISALFLYGHFERAVELGNALLPDIDVLWSARNTRFFMLFHGLAIAAVTWNKLEDPIRSMKNEDVKTPGSSVTEIQPGEADLQNLLDENIKQLEYLKKKIEDWQAVSDVNYLAWSKLLAAQISELRGDHRAAMSEYEEALDHAAAFNFTFEEALGNWLMAGFFLRSKARRPAKAALKEAVMLYRQFGAMGVAKHIEEEHSLLFQGPTINLRTTHVGVQTDFAGDSAPVQYRPLENDEHGEPQRPQTQAEITETQGERIGAWQGGTALPDVGSGLSALDMLDLTSILESSQVISSVLQVDQLLKTMCEIILQNCGGLATLAAIVVEEDDQAGWSIVATADPDKGAAAHIPGIPLEKTTLVAKGVILYCTRFRETVFLPDILHDERFSNVSESWAARNKLGKSVIAIPIYHAAKPLLGVLYLEGQANAFTDRNLTVLQLLVNQIAISYANALTLKEVEKVSASNISMVDLQKRALSKAIEAEAKANLAKAEALRNVQLAEEAAKAKSIFLANVSHELRTPLNGVIGNSELLRDSDLRREQAEMADSIRVSADLLLTVINDILDYSKMEADKMKLFVVAFNPDEMIREVVRSVSYSNRDKKSSKNVQIIQDINLPQSLIFGDPVRLHQVLGNLVGNSLKFTEKGSITIGAKVESETPETIELTCWVKDTGIGIPPQQLAKLFKPFSQADASTARKYGGSGLGLSICKSLIETMMGGKICLESTEGVGTTAWFTVTFPKANSETSAGDSQKVPEPQPIKNPEPSKETSTVPSPHLAHIPRDQLRICIAEDNPINQKIAIQFVEKLGFKNVDAYDNGLEAVEGLRRKAEEGNPYHIILMDVQMPVLDGYEATKLLRRDPIEAVRRTLVIAMTASAIQGDREKCLESGMNDYLAKPVRSGILKKKLDQYLQPVSVDLPHNSRSGS
ncbi:HHK1, histidine kinase-group X protein [Xylogone sp. PMI_703]|nr:HHK1, histidine kinase-group X protein [Xylogone sp. PMI_703]